MFENEKIKRREKMIIRLKAENEELKKRVMEEEVLKDKQIEADALIYQLNELQNKVSEEIRELEQAIKDYTAEKNKFIKLNVEYKRKMDKFFKDIKYKGDDDNDANSE